MKTALITLLVVVALVLILSRIASVRSWAGRVFGRVLPDMSGLGVALKGLASSNAVRIGALVLMIGTPAVLGLVKYFEGHGASKVVVAVERQNSANVERAGRAQIGFERDVRETMEAAALRELEISEEFRDVEQTILEAEGRDGIAAAHAAAVERLRLSAATRHAAAVSDFISSIGPQPMRSLAPA